VNRSAPKSLSRDSGSSLGARVQSIELFAGAGGVAMGLSRSGFHHVLVIERNKDAAETLRSNFGLLDLAESVDDAKERRWFPGRELVEFVETAGPSLNLAPILS
jgi:16S rRNA G966 N2-methylase RsmD